MSSDINNQITAELYAKACEKAKQESIKDECTRHVNPIVSVGTYNNLPTPYVSGFATSDWYEPSTLTTYTNGQEH